MCGWRGWLVDRPAPSFNVYVLDFHIQFWPEPGCHLITSQVLAAVPELSSFKVGTMSVFIQHTSGTFYVGGWVKGYGDACPGAVEFDHTHLSHSQTPSLHNQKEGIARRRLTHINQHIPITHTNLPQPP